MKRSHHARTFLFVSLAFHVMLSLNMEGAAAQEKPVLRIENRGLSEDEIGRMFDGLDGTRIPTGLLVDQVAALVDPSEFDGAPEEPATLDEWRQLFHQLSRSGVGPESLPHAKGGRTVRGLRSVDEVNGLAEDYLRRGLTPLAVLDIPFAKIVPDALDRGLLLLQNGRLLEQPQKQGAAYSTHRAFAAASFGIRARERTVRFIIPRELYFARDAPHPSRLSVDFGDGRGVRTVRIGEVIPIRYDSAGKKTVTIVAETGGQALSAATTLEVSSESIPAPDLVWSDQSAARSYAGGVAGYDAYFFYGAANSVLTRPVVFVEGFDPYYNDPAKRRTWEGIYDMLLQQNFVVRLRALGYDAVIMKLDHAADYVQRNAFALEHLLGRLSAAMPADEEIVVVGPSMGGLIGRYALAYMERNGLEHNVRLFASLDAPQQVANFPLGVQFFLEFNDGDSNLAAQGKAAVNSVAARQMLAYQYRAFPNEDPLRTQLLKEFDDYGYPSTRNIALSNGSGAGQSQLGNERVGYREMVPGDKIVEYRYRSWFIALDGDVWALPDHSPETQIFQGLKNVIGPHYRAQDVFVSGTLPYDNAPGGSRSTQQDIADSEAPYGDIKTAFPDHSWIPTISALDLGTPNLSYDVAVDADGLTGKPSAGKRSNTHFDAIHFPENNEPHIFATEDNVGFLLDEIDTYFAVGRTIAEARTFNSGQHVVVEDGVVVVFDGSVTIASDVRFSLGDDAVLFFRAPVAARGAPSAPIVFERAGAAAWDRLDLTVDGNLFEQVVFHGGTNTVQIRSRDNTFRYCQFLNGWRGVSTSYAYSGGRSSFTMEHSTVAGNSAVGIVAYHTDPRFEFVTIRDNAQTGLWAYDADVRTFYKSIVTNNALGPTSRSGVEILAGSYVDFVGPDYGRGYTRVAGNTHHEVYVSSSAGGAFFGYNGMGGHNAVFDHDEGTSAAGEKLLRSSLSQTLLADQTYWGGIDPGADDLFGAVYLGTVLYSDPTAEPQTLEVPLLAEQGRGVNAATEGDHIRMRMAEIRRKLKQESPGGSSAGLLRELSVLQRLDPDQDVNEGAANRDVYAAWRAKLANTRGVDALDVAAARQAGEVAALLEIRDAILEERYDAAANLIERALPLVRTPHNRRALLLEHIAMLEREARYTEALAMLDRVTASAGRDEPPEIYTTARENLQERIAASRGGAGASSDLLADSGLPSTPGGAYGISDFMLGTGHPNPFNPETMIPFTLGREADVRIEVYDLLARRVAVLADGPYASGAHQVRFDARHLPSGMYFIRARVGAADGTATVVTRKVTLLK